MTPLTTQQVIRALEWRVPVWGLAQYVVPPMYRRAVVWPRQHQRAWMPEHLNPKVSGWEVFACFFSEEDEAREYVKKYPTTFTIKHGRLHLSGDLLVIRIEDERIEPLFFGFCDKEWQTYVYEHTRKFK